MKELPIISITLNNMRTQVHHAFTAYQLDLDGQVQQALKEALSPLKIQQLIDRKVEEAVRQVIEQEVDNYFHWGPGRKVLKESCHELLDRLLSQGE